MAQYRARVTSKGQVTVPVSVRRALGVNEGDDLLFDVQPDGVRVMPGRSGEVFQRLAGHWRQAAGKHPEEVDAWLRDLRGHEAP